MSRTSKVTLFILIVIGIHLYYSFPREDREKILNPNYWENPYTYFEEGPWVKAGNIELSAFDYNIFLFHPNNFFGFSYNIDNHIRYKQWDEKTAKQIKKIRTVKSFDEMKNIGLISKHSNPLHIEDYLVAYEDSGLEESTSYPKRATSVQLQFHTGMIPPKYLEFTDEDGNSFFVNTNPLFFFRTLTGQVLLIFIMMLLWFYFMLGFSELLFFFLLPSIFWMNTYYLFWYFLVYLFITSIFISMKIRFIQDNSLCYYKYLGALKYIFAISVFLFYFYLKEFFDSLMYSLIFLYFFPSAFKAIYLLYFHVRYPKILVTEIFFTNPIEDHGKFKQFPRFFCDVIINGTIHIYGASTQLRLCRKIERQEKIKILYYKTDNKGNYILYDE